MCKKHNRMTKADLNQSVFPTSNDGKLFIWKTESKIIYTANMSLNLDSKYNYRWVKLVYVKDTISRTSFRAGTNL